MLSPGRSGYSHTTTFRRTGAFVGPEANSSGEWARMRSMSLNTERRGACWRFC